MRGRLSLAAACLAFVAVGNGAISTVAATPYINIKNTGPCPATTTTITDSNGDATVTMVCAVTGTTTAAPTFDTAGIVTFKVTWAVAGGFPCPAANSAVTATYLDAYGSFTLTNGQNTWQDNGPDPITKLPVCQFITDLSNWQISGKRAYSGMAHFGTGFWAQIPGLSVPETQNQISTSGVAIGLTE